MRSTPFNHVCVHEIECFYSLKVRSSDSFIDSFIDSLIMVFLHTMHKAWLDD